MDAERIARVRKRMARESLDALVCRLPANVLLLSGHWTLNGVTFLYFPADGTPTCIVPHCDECEAEEELWDARCVSFRFGVLGGADPLEAASKALRDAMPRRGCMRVGFEGAFEQTAPPWNAAEPTAPAAPTKAMLDTVFGADRLVDATDLLLEMRSIKTPTEKEKLRRVNEIATTGLDVFQKAVDVGVTGVELVSRVESAILVHGTGYEGARRVRAFAQVSTGSDETALGYRPMEAFTKRPLEPADLALLELAVVADGFWCDRTRVRVAGSPSNRQQEVFQVIVEAQEAAIAKAKPGALTGDVDAAARSIMDGAGLKDEFFHVTGHGLGFQYHEPVPLICPGGTCTLLEGMLHTVEPGAYAPGFGGMRVEDNVFITSSGADVLGPFKKELSS